VSRSLGELVVVPLPVEQLPPGFQRAALCRAPFRVVAVHVNVNLDPLGVLQVVGEILSGRLVWGDLDRDALASKGNSL
jgi:hypothetical protein